MAIEGMGLLTTLSDRGESGDAGGRRRALVVEARMRQEGSPKVRFVPEPAEPPVWLPLTALRHVEEIIFTTFRPRPG
jgi:hypothetical protein